MVYFPVGLAVGTVPVFPPDVCGACVVYLPVGVEISLDVVVESACRFCLAAAWIMPIRVLAGFLISRLLRSLPFILSVISSIIRVHGIS